jgi:hypothetical protein
MTSRSAPLDKVEIRLRYRPTGDQLIGEVAIESMDEIVDELDSDTSVTWARPSGHSPVEPVLSSFSIIGARRRFRDSPPDFLPAAVWSVATSMFRSMPATPPGSLARLEARSEARLVLSVDELRRPADLSRSDTSDVSSARALASSLRSLSSSLRLAIDSFDTTDPHVGTPARRFVDGLETMSSLVVAHRVATPSVVSDLVANLRGGLPLSDRERKRLRVALDRTLDPLHWKSAAHELNQLAAAVRGERGIDSAEGT